MINPHPVYRTLSDVSNNGGRGGKGDSSTTAKGLAWASWQSLLPRARKHVLSCSIKSSHNQLGREIAPRIADLVAPGCSARLSLWIGKGEACA
jgi:hypothetical protein